MSITITRVKYPKAENVLEIDYTEPLAGFTSPPERNNIFKTPGAHPHLRTALEGLRIHYAIMMGWIMPIQVEDIADSDHLVQDKYFVSGFNYFTDKDGINSIMITGYHIVMDHACPTNSPKWVLTEDGPKDYIFAKHINKVIAKISRELSRYMFENKRAQLEMEFDTPPVTNMKIAEPSAQKLVDKVGGGMKVEAAGHEEATGGRRRGRPRKVAQTAAAPSGEVIEEEKEEEEEITEE